MTSAQYRAAIKRLGMSQGDAAKFLGVSPRASWGYANGAPVPVAVAKLLRLVVQLGIKPEDVIILR